MVNTWAFCCKKYGQCVGKCVGEVYTKMYEMYMYLCECVHVLCLGQVIESREYGGIVLQEVWAMCGEVCG